MADTGFVFPGTAVGNRTITGGDKDWSTPSGITADDISDAFWGTFTPTEQSNGLAGSNFDFSSIPSGATIDGIEIRVGDYSESALGGQEWAVLRLILADDTDGSDNRFDELTAIPADPTETTDEVGGASDLWSETITDTDVKDVDWGFFVGTESSGITNCFVDFFQMKVYYTAAAAPFFQTDWLVPGALLMQQPSQTGKSIILAEAGIPLLGAGIL